MKDSETIAAYVDAACALHRLALTLEQRVRVMQTFGMNAQIVAPLLEFELPAEIEAAPVFKA